MEKFIGIDLGTSSVKAIMISENGIEKSTQRNYAVSCPKASCFEQNPTDWYKQTLSALEELLCNTDTSEIKAISFSGQMHGLVMLDINDNVIRPAVLWNDGRAVKETAFLNNDIGEDFLLKHTGNIAFAGFTAPKLLWVKKNEPESFAKAAKIMLPKDYLAYMLSGVFATDVSDASGTLYFDVANRKWSKEMLDIIEIDESCLPVVYESSDTIATIKPELADRLRLSKSVKIVIGGGDNACSAIGTGTVKSGSCNISLGTSGTIFVETDKHNYDRNSAIHSFCSASGGYHYLACILSAASCQKWWIEKILKTDYNTEAQPRYIGKNNVYFLPYLTGERSPLNNPEAKAVFYGMTPDTTREKMSLSVLEGVAFALKQNLEIIKALKTDVTKASICGGGAKNRLWLEILANTLNVKLEIPSSEQGGALGAALLAAKGIMNDKDYNEFSSRFYKATKTIMPTTELVEAYNEKFETFLSIQKKLL